MKRDDLAERLVGTSRAVGDISGNDTMMMIDHDDMRFSSFTRDLARRHRRPRSYPTPPPFLHDALEQLCGGLKVPAVVVASAASLSRWPEDLSEIDLLSDEDEN